ncbi:hypothetical protein L204_103184 [Cryptococcus depauperatus]|nr:hypothetical protein L204_00070 [Cryptococcus depauperatus CBS 7855]
MSAAASIPTPLEPTLYSLLPISLHTSVVSHLSLLSIHAEPYLLIERIYQTTNPVLQGQTRSLRFRSRRILAASLKGKGKEIERQEWVHDLAYISLPLRSAEYSEASVRAILGLEIQDMSQTKEIEEFITALGFQHSHTYTLTGHLFHLPLPRPAKPPLTLHLSITRLSLLPEQVQEGPLSNEPYIVQLRPSRPVYAIAQPGDIRLQDTIALMQSITGQIDNLEWTTGSSL